ncbi:amino acid ABC transporter permease [Falsiroseomonas sp. HW251]|uniref:amino acid ABC transporter permease n=1 Tax=Falsiroseomonas sp. HW251 TaxID=3390998 RepID=UPI003D3109CC
MTPWDTILAEAPRFFTWWNLRFLLEALGNTIVASVLGCAIGYALGFALAALRLPQLIPFAPLRAFCILWVETFRRIPFLVLLLLVFFLAQFAKLEAPLSAIAVTAVAIRMSALAAENVRAGLESVRATQWEAALTMNIAPWTVLRRVVLPQAWRVILPPSIAHVLSMVKETSLVSQIGFIEITFAAKMLTQRGFSALLTYGTALVLYFLLGWALHALGRYAERKLTRRPAGPEGPTRTPSSPPAASPLPVG